MVAGEDERVCAGDGEALGEGEVEFVANLAAGLGLAVAVGEGAVALPPCDAAAAAAAADSAAAPAAVPLPAGVGEGDTVGDVFDEAAVPLRTAGD